MTLDSLSHITPHFAEVEINLNLSSCWQSWQKIVADLKPLWFSKMTTDQQKNNGFHRTLQPRTFPVVTEPFLTLSQDPAFPSTESLTLRQLASIPARLIRLLFGEKMFQKSVRHQFPGGIHGGQSSSRSGLLIDIELLTRLGQVGSGDGNEH